MLKTFNVELSMKLPSMVERYNQTHVAVDEEPKDKVLHLGI